MKKVMLVFGTRPEAIKMAPLVLEFRKYPEVFDVVVCVTAQHREMLDQVLNLFKIIPDVDLNLMKNGQDLYDMTSSVLMGLRDVLRSYSPNIVLVHGDTTTSLAAAMAAYYSGISVGHVEAGLRTHNINAPFPEEFNRQVVSKLADIHFAPTNLARENLLSERVNAPNILTTGNTVIDALHWVLEKQKTDFSNTEKIKDKLLGDLGFDYSVSPFVLITGHRRENFGDGFIQICEAIRDLAKSYLEYHFVYPVHLNPNVCKPVNKILQGIDNVHLIKPLDYEPFVYLLNFSYLVLTDSGGIQEEAPSLGKPVLVMRDLTERPEAVEAGTVKLVGAKRDQIFTGVSKLLNDENYYLDMSRAHNPYGDGTASEKIIAHLKK
jgi:UDP-N-acetylglucosamine 2-epimerase (non-hydrolysing)